MVSVPPKDTDTKEDLIIEINDRLKDQINDESITPSKLVWN